jgi:succinoglycan biosynthesis protein ExoO
MSVSVIIPAFNAQETIERAVTTVLAQTRPPLEVIVVDDASKDGTRELVRRLAKADPRVKLLENEVNRGPSGSRNRGFAAAAGEWVAIQDADDAWVETRLELMLDAAERHGADFVADNMLLHDAGTDQITRTGFAVERGLRWIKPIDPFEQDVQLGAEFGYGLLQPMIRKRFLDEHGLAYNETLRYGEDMIFLMEMLFCGIRAIIIPDPGYIYTTRVGEFSGVASPHSKSVPRFDLISDGLDLLRAKYPQAITPQIERAMSRLGRRYRVVHASNVARQERLQRGLLAYAAYLGRRPSVIAHVLRQQGRKLVARWSANAEARSKSSLNGAIL